MMLLTILLRDICLAWELTTKRKCAVAFNEVFCMY